jgi:Glycine zipper 2TM domain
MNRNSKLSALVMSGISASLLLVSPATARGGGGYYNDYSSDYESRTYQGSYDDGGGYDRGRDYRRDARDRRCSKGTGGMIIGAVAGGLLGRTVVSRRGDRTAGTIVGAGVGALAGRAIDRSGGRRC